MAPCGGIRPGTGSALWMQSAIIHTIVMVWSHRFMCKTESELSLLTPPFRPPASSFATAQSENGVSRKGLRIWQSPTRFPSSCLKHDEPPLAHKENSISRLGAQDGCTCACREASTPARWKPAIICRMVLDSGNAYSLQRRERGCQTKGVISIKCRWLVIHVVSF